MTASAGKRVLMLLENSVYPHDGRVRREARCLVDAGYRVTVISPREDGKWHDTFDGVHAYRYKAPRQRDGLAGYAIEYGYSMVAAMLLSIWVFFTRGFDVVHAHNPPDTFVLIAFWYRLLGRKFIFDHHDLSPEMYDARFGDAASPTVHRALLVFERLTFRQADHVIATNESYKEIAVSRGKVPPHRVTVVRNGPQLSRVRAVEPDEDLRGPAGTPVIGYVGELAPQDGVDYLVRALGVLAERGDDFRAYIVGRGASLESLRALATELGLDDKVTLTGYVPDADLMRILSTADICVSPDPKNPFTDRSTMIKLTEYMALAKPMVVFDLTEHRRTAGDAALYATPNEVEDFADKLSELSADPERRMLMGKLGRERVESQLSWEHQTGHLLAAYRQVLGLGDATVGGAAA